MVPPGGTRAPDDATDFEATRRTMRGAMSDARVIVFSGGGPACEVRRSRAVSRVCAQRGDGAGRAIVQSARPIEAPR